MVCFSVAVFGVGAEFTLPQNDDVLSDVADVNLSINDTEGVLNVTFSLRNDTIDEIIYSTSTATYVGASEAVVAFDFDTTEYADGYYDLIVDIDDNSGFTSENINVFIENILDTYCWDLETEEECMTDGSCKWDFWGESCYQAGCWDFWDFDACEDASLEFGLPCQWNTGGSGGWCEEAGACWNYYDETTCDGADGCTWDATEYCFEKDCWSYNTREGCDEVADLGCFWDGWNCVETSGCWNYWEEFECETAEDGCMWKEDEHAVEDEFGDTHGWCEEEACWNYNDEDDCLGSNLGCGWGVDDWDNESGWCYELGCWDYNTSEDCLSGGDRCAWDEGGEYCFETGCWNYWNETGCLEDVNCDWGGQGWCAEEGCWNFNESVGCLGEEGCNWEEAGWCTEPGCWNYNTQLDCDQHDDEGCLWNTEWQHCEEIDCYSFETEAVCNIYNESLNCFWNGWQCEKKGCWNYWNTTSCQANAGEGCAWENWEGCEPRFCWNYDSETECDADTDCEWDAYCTGDSTLDCWQYDVNRTACTLNGCKWKGDCHEIGCWSYETTNECLAESECGWEVDGHCEDKGCWDYYTQGTCNAVSGCEWDTEWEYCYEEGCWEYETRASCNQQSFRNCFWDEEEDYCYEKDCWEYGTKAECNTDSEGLGNCAWDSEEEYCYDQGCWVNGDEATCDTLSNCEWIDYGWCYEEGCWNFNNSFECTANPTCAWEDNWDYCYEKGCWEYNESSSCALDSKCTWDGSGEYCYEEGCWNFDKTTCLANNEECYWENSSSSGWCHEQGCWDYDDSGTCEGNGCAWDYEWDYCYEEGCWVNSDSDSCDLNNCTWEQDFEGWCYEEGCWDYWDQDSCESADGCLWEEDYDYCYEEGCWEYDDDPNGCNSSGKCQWREENWGWCEEPNCWSLYTENDCDNENDNLDCSWDSDWNYCEEVSCYAFDFAGEDACENNAYDLECEYLNGWCDPAGGFCEDFNGNFKGCMDTFYCFYDFDTEECLDPDDEGDDGFVEGLLEFNPGCWLFDMNETSCDNTDLCVYNVATDTASSCDNKPGYEGLPLQCENITEPVLCNSLPALATCCVWRNGTCMTDYSNTECKDNVEDPGEGSNYCEDDNPSDSLAECERIANHPWYMPCRWSGTECTFSMDDVLGEGGDFFDVKTESMCDKIGGEWKCEYYCDDKGTAATDDDLLKTECWCKAGTGTESFSCDKSCWACEDPEEGEFTSIDEAQSRCEQSAANCIFEEDGNAPNGFGYCDFSDEASQSGSCDTSCDSCNDVMDDEETAKPETKIACLESEAGCKWDKNLANPSEGECIDDTQKTCEDKCSKCSEDECEEYGVGEAGACEWDDNDNECIPSNIGDNEQCSDTKDNDNDGMVDCEDSDCFFSEDCGGDDMSDCPKYDHSEEVCNNSAIFEGSPIDCTWIVDPIEGDYCGHPSEACKLYNDDEAQCNGQSGACEYVNDGGCSINNTKENSCRGKPEGACSGDCMWVEDNNDKVDGGSCEFKMFALCHDPEIDSQSECTTGTNSQYCAWIYDINSPIGGWCEPKCFTLDQVSCGTNTKCEWFTGWCEPNMTTSDDCIDFDNTDQATCEGTGVCIWEDAGFEGECEPEIDFDVVVDCWEEYHDPDTCNADAECFWIEDPYSPKGGFCDLVAFACYDIGMAVLEEQGAAAAEAACDNLTPDCVWDNTWQECLTVCEYNSEILNESCNTIPGCQEFSGWCDPKGAGTMFSKMDAPPEDIKYDDCNEAGLDAYNDICVLGVTDVFDILGIGASVRSMEDSAACNGEFIMDWESMEVEEGQGEEPTKTEFYLNADGDWSEGCTSSDGAISGLDYRFVLESTLANKEQVSKEKCINSEWDTCNDCDVFAVANAMCTKAGGPVIMMDTDTLDDLDTNYDLGIYVVTVDLATSQTLDTIEGKYTLGTIGGIPEDCFGFVDKDGDGKLPAQDEDCKFIMKYGGMVFEDCHNGVDDEDADDDADCDDTECKFLPHCEGELYDFEADENDTTSASIIRYEVETFPDAAFVEFDSDEPANGTVLFYLNDSTCTTVAKTIYDVGVTNADIPEYKLWHEAALDDGTLGYTLDNGTTYYIKLVVCDKAGNPCGRSACLNFTTEVSIEACGVRCEPVFDIPYVPPEGDEHLSGAGTQWDFGDGYEDKPCGGLGGFKKGYGETDDVGFKVSNEGGNSGFGASASGSDLKWSIEFNEMNIKGAVDTNRTRIRQNEILVNETGDGIGYVGMDHSRWAAIKDELNPKFVTVCVPGQVTRLYHCSDANAVSVDDCTDVTDYVVDGPTYISSLDCTEFTVSADLGFSVYFGSNTAQERKNTGGSGGGSGSCYSKWYCSDWTECENGWQERECQDIKKCNPATTEMPAISKKCTIVKVQEEEEVRESPITGLAIADKAEEHLEQFEELQEQAEVGTGFGRKIFFSTVIVIMVVMLVGMFLTTTMAVYRSKKEPPMNNQPPRTPPSFI